MAITQVSSILAVLLVVVGGQQHHDRGHAESFVHFQGPVVGHAHPVVVTVKDEHGHSHEVHDYVAHPKYEFAYGVSDHHTGDFHRQKETRDGDHVVGEYSLVEPSGNVRTVKYVADKGGFQAEVHNSHDNIHPPQHHEAPGSRRVYASREGLGIYNKR